MAWYELSQMVTPPHLPKADKIKLIKFEIPGTVRKLEQMQRKTGKFYSTSISLAAYPIRDFWLWLPANYYFFFGSTWLMDITARCKEIFTPDLLGLNGLLQKLLTWHSCMTLDPFFLGVIMFISKIKIPQRFDILLHYPFSCNQMPLDVLCIFPFYCRKASTFILNVSE